MLQYEASSNSKLEPTLPSPQIVTPTSAMSPLSINTKISPSQGNQSLTS